MKLRAFLGLISAVAVLCAALAPAAFASKPGGGGTSGGGTIGLVLLDSTDGLPHFGQQVTFNVSTTATSEPWVTLYCYQDGSLVYQGSNGIFPTSLGQIFTLASNSWTSGAGDCTAWLQNWDNYAKHGTIRNLASISFHVYA
jgi:hypothetical protein